MYVDKIFCEDMGPIGKVYIAATFSGEGNPKPIVLVGKNGSGKTVLLSSIVDALHELGCKAFQDVAKVMPGGGHKYFKITSQSHIRIGESRLISYVSFRGEEDCKLEYLYCQGQVDVTACKKEIEQNIQTSIGISPSETKDKVVSSNKKVVEKSFSSGVLCYFPAYRYAIPSWVGRDYIKDRDVDPYRRQFSNNLNRSIIVDNARIETPLWIEDVVIDSRAELVFDSTGIRTTSDIGNVRALSTARANVEKVLSAILERPVAIKLGYRRDREWRLAICDKKTNQPITPTFDALSTGQTVLIELFTTILRYADAIDINKTIDLSSIEGVVLIDEVDAHLHIDLLYDVLPQVMKLFPKVQFIVTAHSPMFILGMEKQYGTTGFDLYELPSGVRIDAESYNEFHVAIERMEETNAVRRKIAKQVQDATSEIHRETEAATETIVITEGFTDWKHLERAWSVLSSGYPELEGKIKFLHYHPNGQGKGEPEFEMGDAQLVEMCKQFAKVKQKSRFVFVSDADNPKITKDFVGGDDSYKDWGNNVFSFQLPDPELRPGFSAVCIEHYYSDDDLKTFVEIEGIKRRLFLSGEFNPKTGKTVDREFFYENHKSLKPDKPFGIIENCVYKDMDNSPQPVNYALPKNDFAEALLKGREELLQVDFSAFRKVFDVLKMIVAKPLVL